MTAVSLTERAWEIILEEARGFKEHPNTMTCLTDFTEGEYSELLFRLEDRVASVQDEQRKSIFGDEEVLDLHWRLEHHLEDLFHFVKAAMGS